jgi:Holliday junction DNA helicase RuvA
MSQHDYEIIAVMIVTLSGIIDEKTTAGAVLDVAGVGYGLSVTSEDFGRLQIGQPAKVHVYEHIREQSYDLFGFLDKETKYMFEQLLGVKNVGPKVALAVLDIGPASTVRSAIANGDVRLLQSAKGVGKRAAEQIVVELRDKVGLTSSETADDVVNRPGINTQDEATEALVALGYTSQDAAAALRAIDTSLPVEERLKQALRSRR